VPSKKLPANACGAVVDDLAVCERDSAGEPTFAGEPERLSGAGYDKFPDFLARTRAKSRQSLWPPAWMAVRNLMDLPLLVWNIAFGAVTALNFFLTLEPP
jgi:hypothetical protein